MKGRLRALAAATFSLALALVLIALDAQARVQAGRARDEANASIAAATGLSELALSTSSTWLRHPALAVPSAGTSDAPLGLDVDPAGAVIPRHAHEPTITLQRQTR